MYARQGDLIIDRRDSAPVNLERTTTEVVLAGSHGGRHLAPAGIEYGRDGRVHYLRPTQDCEIKHDTRHKPIPMSAGQIYWVWPQIERRGEGDVDVGD